MLAVSFMLSLLCHDVRFPLPCCHYWVLSLLLPSTMCFDLLMCVGLPCRLSMQKTALQLLKCAMNDWLSCYAGTCVKCRHALGVSASVWTLPLDPLGRNSKWNGARGAMHHVRWKCGRRVVPNCHLRGSIDGALAFTRRCSSRELKRKRWHNASSLH